MLEGFKRDSAENLAFNLREEEHKYDGTNEADVTGIMKNLRRMKGVGCIVSKARA